MMLDGLLEFSFRWAQAEMSRSARASRNQVGVIDLVENEAVRELQGRIRVSSAQGKATYKWHRPIGMTT